MSYIWILTIIFVVVLLLELGECSVWSSLLDTFTGRNREPEKMGAVYYPKSSSGTSRPPIPLTEADPVKEVSYDLKVVPLETKEKLDKKKVSASISQQTPVYKASRTQNFTGHIRTSVNSPSSQIRVASAKATFKTTASVATPLSLELTRSKSTEKQMFEAILGGDPGNMTTILPLKHAAHDHFDK